MGIVDTWLEFKEIILFNVRYPCFMDSMEAGVEAGIVAYAITKYVFKRPERALKFAAGLYILTPMVYWPFCIVNHERKKILEERTGQVIEQLPPTSEIDKV